MNSCYPDDELTIPDVLRAGYLDSALDIRSKVHCQARNINQNKEAATRATRIILVLSFPRKFILNLIIRNQAELRCDFGSLRFAGLCSLWVSVSYQIISASYLALLLPILASCHCPWVYHALLHNFCEA